MIWGYPYFWKHPYLVEKISRSKRLFFQGPGRLSENLNAERPQRCGYLEIWTLRAFRVSYTLGRFSLILILGCPVVGSDRINGLFHLLISGVYWSYNIITNLLLTSWDIQVGHHFFRVLLELVSIPTPSLDTYTHVQVGVRDLKHRVADTALTLKEHLPVKSNG